MNHNFLTKICWDCVGSTAQTVKMKIDLETRGLALSFLFCEDCLILQCGFQVCDSGNRQSSSYSRQMARVEKKAREREAGKPGRDSQ